MKHLIKLKEKHEYYKSRDEVAPFIQVGIWTTMMIPASFYVIDLVDHNYDIENKIMLVTLLLGGIFQLIEKLIEKYVIDKESSWWIKFFTRTVIGAASMTCYSLAFGTLIGW